MDLKYQRYNPEIFDSVKQWYERVLIYNDPKDIWDPSLNIHIDEILGVFKYKWNWVEASFYVLNLMRSMEFISTSQYVITLNISMNYFLSRPISDKISDIKVLRKYTDRSTPPSFYLFRKGENSFESLKDEARLIKIGEDHEGYLFKSSYIVNELLVEVMSIDVYNILNNKN